GGPARATARARVLPSRAGRRGASPAAPAGRRDRGRWPPAMPPPPRALAHPPPDPRRDRKSTRLNSSHVATSYAVFCLKRKTNIYWTDVKIVLRPPEKATNLEMCFG